MLQTKKLIMLFFASLAAQLLYGCATMPAVEQNPALPVTAELLAPQPTATPIPRRGFTLVSGGDVLPGYFLDPYLEKNGFDYPFSLLSAFFKAADIGLVNLECPVSLRGKRVKKKEFTFRANPETLPALKRAGINAVALANNHMMDYGPDALLDTIAALDKTGIYHSGAGKNQAAAAFPAQLVIPNGPTIALLSYSLTYPSTFWASAKHPGTAFARLGPVEADIASATAWASSVIVCFHWGGEMQTYPRDYQIEYAHAAIDAGAKLVLGTHPHILQGVEWYKQGVIFYSLGNLVFGGGRSKRAITSALAKIDFTADGDVLAAAVLPISVDNIATAFVPCPVSDRAAEKIFRSLRTLSSAWGTQFLPDETGWGQVKPQATPQL